MFLLNKFLSLRNLITKFLIKILPKKKTGKQISNRQTELLDQYNKGLILQVDKDIDNKEFLRSEDPQKYLKNIKETKIQNQPQPKIQNQPQPQK